MNERWPALCEQGYQSKGRRCRRCVSAAGTVAAGRRHFRHQPTPSCTLPHTLLSGTPSPPAEPVAPGGGMSWAARLKSAPPAPPPAAPNGAAADKAPKAAPAPAQPAAAPAAAPAPAAPTPTPAAGATTGVKLPPGVEGALGRLRAAMLALRAVETNAPCGACGAQTCMQTRLLGWRSSLCGMSSCMQSRCVGAQVACTVPDVPLGPNLPPGCCRAPAVHQVW